MHRALLRRNLESLVKDLIAEFGEPDPAIGLEIDDLMR